MRNASHTQSRASQARAKVAVIPAQVPTEETKRQQLQEQITIALVGLGALVAAGVA